MAGPTENFESHFEILLPMMEVQTVPGYLPLDHFEKRCDVCRGCPVRVGDWCELAGCSPVTWACRPWNRCPDGRWDA